MYLLTAECVVVLIWTKLGLLNLLNITRNQLKNDFCQKIPYDGKLSRKETFANIRGFVVICESFLCEIWEFSPLKVSRYR